MPLWFSLIVLNNVTSKFKQFLFCTLLILSILFFIGILDTDKKTAQYLHLH